ASACLRCAENVYRASEPRRGVKGAPRTLEEELPLSRPCWTTLALLVAAAPFAVNAAGADGSWALCSPPAPPPAMWGGRTFHVATWGTDPWDCPSWSGYTFGTITAAVRCAWGGDTVYVHNGTYGPVSIANKWQGNDILITNAPGENPVIDGWSSMGDYQA